VKTGIAADSFKVKFSGVIDGRAEEKLMISNLLRDRKL
jgi:hypothetical protein